jgi:SAM-dependent methyltransferase
MSDTDLSVIHAAVAEYYDAALATHGPTPRGVDWRDARSHFLRHAQFLRLTRDDPEASVIDLGCGYGDFLTTLRNDGHRGHYLGLDVAPGMIAAARSLHGETDGCTWQLGAEPNAVADYAVASGIMNVRRGASAAVWQAYLDGIIDTLARCSRRGFGFNMLTLWSDPEKRRADLHYADPVAMFAYCLQRWGRHVAVLQDYGLWEFTVLVRHASQTASPNPVAP